MNMTNEFNLFAKTTDILTEGFYFGSRRANTYNIRLLTSRHNCLSFLNFDNFFIARCTLCFFLLVNWKLTVTFKINTYLLTL